MPETAEYPSKKERFIQLFKNKTKFELVIISVSVLLALVPIAFGFYYIHQYGVNIPRDDQWSGLVRPTINYYDGNFDPSFIISEQNDSRQVFIIATIESRTIFTSFPSSTTRCTESAR